MNTKVIKILLFFLTVSTLSCQTKKTDNYSVDDSLFLSYEINLNKQNLAFYLKKNDSTNFKNFKTLKEYLEKKGESLVFAANGGMFNKHYQPQGLYIEKSETISKIDTVKNGFGNFYLQPNGVFYITKDKKAIICKTTDFKNKNTIEFATQSGPMLVVDNAIHSSLKKGSSNLNIRNGVGILPNGNLLFAMSKNETNFYDFATFFKQNGCKNALYLDGFVSKTYLPKQEYKEMNGEFGVIIAETKKLEN